MNDNRWPLQSECEEFYGNVKSIEARLSYIELPFTMFYGTRRVDRIRIHSKCANSLSRVFAAVDREYSERYVETVYRARALQQDGISEFDGTYCMRMMRGSNHYSMHAYGCAIDIDANHNARGTYGRFNNSSPLVRAFKDEGWIWGGDWSGLSHDPMHFQAARVG